MVQAVFDPDGRGGDLSDRSRTKDDPVMNMLTSTRAAVPAAAICAGMALAVMPLVAQAAAREPVWVKSITGSQDYGFHIVWSDGDQTYTPTRSETLAECGEYDTRVERVACRASTRTEYRWMGLTKRSLHHAR